MKSYLLGHSLEKKWAPKTEDQIPNQWSIHRRTINVITPPWVFTPMMGTWSIKKVHIFSEWRDVFNDNPKVLCKFYFPVWCVLISATDSRIGAKLLEKSIILSSILQHTTALWCTQRKRLNKPPAVSIMVIQVAVTCILRQTFLRVSPLLFITHSSYLISLDLSGVSEDMPYIMHHRLLNETVLSFRPKQLAANIWTPTSAYIHERLFFSSLKVSDQRTGVQWAQSSAHWLSISED